MITPAQILRPFEGTATLSACFQNTKPGSSIPIIFIGMESRLTGLAPMATMTLMLKNLRSLSLSSLCLLLSCTGSSSFSEGPLDPQQKKFSAQGLTFERPEGWHFVTPNNPAKDTVLGLRGPSNGTTLAPIIEVTARPLEQAALRRKSSHIVVQAITEITQFFEGFETLRGPDDVQIAGLPATRIDLSFLEPLPEGGEATKRVGRFYGLVHNNHLWILRFIAAPGGAHDPVFDSVLGAIKL